jgi:quercetin dioxygenase-like cupin family protein
MDPTHRASPASDIQRRALYTERPHFRIQELQISPSQEVPWHYQHEVQDTLYVLEGQTRVLLREPEEEVLLNPGETYRTGPSNHQRRRGLGSRSSTCRPGPATTSG